MHVCNGNNYTWCGNNTWSISGAFLLKLCALFWHYLVYGFGKTSHLQDCVLRLCVTHSKLYEFLLEQFLGCFSSCAAHTLLTNLTWTNCDGFWFEIILAIQSLRIRVAIQSLRIVCNMISMYDCIGYCNMQIFSLVVWVGYTVKHNGIKYWWH